MSEIAHGFSKNGIPSTGAEIALSEYAKNNHTHIDGGSGEPMALGDLTDVSTSGATVNDLLGFTGSGWGPVEPPSGGDPGSVSSDDITDATDLGKSLITAVSQIAAREDLGVYPIPVPPGATAAEINSLIAGATDGAYIDFGPGERTLDAPIVVANGVHLVGGWTINGTSVAGTRLIFPDAIDTSDGAIQMQHDYATATGIFVTGVGKVLGSIGWMISGESSDFTHGVRLIECGAALFDYGAMNGAWSDHTTFFMCKFSGNNHGVGFAEDNNYDFDFISCFLEGNTHCSSHLQADTSLANVSMIRCHLGWSEYGIFQETTASGQGYAGITLIDSPIENVSQQFVKMEYGGNIRISGGYWLWGGTPANPAVYVKELNTGHLYLQGVRLEPTTPNANSPALVDVDTAAPGCEVHISIGRLSAFALAFYSGTPAAIINNRPTNRIYRDGANQGLAWDAAGLYLDTPGVNVVIRDSSASYVTRMRWWAAGNQLIVNSISLGAAGATGGPSWTFGTGAPSASQPNGSFYSRTDGAGGSTIYARVAGAWVAIA